MKTYLGIDVASSMFAGAWTTKIVRKVLSVEEAKEKIAKGVSVIFCLDCNRDVLELMLEQYELKIRVAEDMSYAKICLGAGDSVIVLDVDYLRWVAEGRKLGENPETDKAFVEYTIEPEPIVVP